MPPYAEGCRDVIDNEVVSLSYLYTIAIYVRTRILLVASTSTSTLLSRILLGTRSSLFPFYTNETVKYNKGCLVQRLVTFQQLLKNYGLR